MQTKLDMTLTTLPKRRAKQSSEYEGGKVGEIRSFTNAHEIYTEATNIHMSDGAMAEDVMMSAITVLGPDHWWVSDIKWAAYKATAATIFFARVKLTHKQRRHRSTVDWRRNTLH